MWEPGFHHISRNASNSIYDVKGDLTLEEAQNWFAQYCRSNPAFAARILTGINLWPIQDLIIRSFWIKDFSLMIAGRGFSKSFTVSMFIVLYAIANPESKIGICSGGFRQAKLIFEQIEKWINDPVRGRFLRAEVTKKPSHKSDTWSMEINRSVIKAIPLTDKIRGERFNVMIIDELAQVPDEIISNVIIPFMSVEQNADHRSNVRSADEALIKHGKITESERIKFSGNKMIGLSSAVFKCDPLYKEYFIKYQKIIRDPAAEGVSHCIWKLSYEVAPKGKHADLKNIKEAERKLSKAQFDREYRAIFTDDSAGYFGAEAIEAATIKDGDPKVRLVGRPDRIYIMGLDPNNSDNDLSDNFAMALLEVDPATKVGTLVHVYALAKSTLKNRANYMKYLFNHFNIVYLVVDNAGGDRFIKTIQEFIPEFPKISIFTHGIKDEDSLKQMRRDYNLSQGRIVHDQFFGQPRWKLDANDAMKADIEHKNLLFAAPIYKENDINIEMQRPIPIQEISFSDIKYDKMETKQNDFIENLNDNLEMTKKELRLIDVKPNASGNIDFNVPKQFRSSTDIHRVKRDAYTALLMANWGRRCYFEMFEKQEEDYETFIPIFC